MFESNVVKQIWHDFVFKHRSLRQQISDSAINCNIIRYISKKNTFVECNLLKNDCKLIGATTLLFS